MNTSSSLKRYSPRTSGVALVIVLSIIVLLSALLVAFMSSVSTESASAKAAVRGIEARQVAESALNLAISQIRDATRGDAAKRSAWASQPGLIRQFDESGNDGLVYKLYTAKEMVVGGGQFPPGVDPKNPNSAKSDETLEEAG
ncbi:MAG: Verru Chthon cassette protein, partial [Verrucomicrobiota bacterium]